MKKFIIFLVAMLIVMPGGVNAVNSVVLEMIVPQGTTSADDCPDGEVICRYTMDTWLLASEVISIPKGTEITASFTPSDDAIKFESVVPATGLTVLTENTNSVVFVVTADSYEISATSNTDFATFVFSYDNDGSLTNCKVEFSVPTYLIEDEPEEEKDTTTNPETGNFVPLVGLSGVAVAGAGVYFISRKKSKMFNI